MADRMNQHQISQEVSEQNFSGKVLANHYFYRKYGKRFFDIILSASGLVVCVIPILIIGMIVRLSSPGPSLFYQLRAGRKGKMFVLYKFRSMYTSAPEKSNREFTQDLTETYVTGFGSFMRRTSLDELPQLINVLKGDMSLIGPRPLAKTDSRVLELRAQSGADRIRPGISGLAQVNGRNEISDDLKAKWDSEYAKHISFTYDIGIVIRTFAEVLAQRGINNSDHENSDESKNE
ncbi:lipopolysaccharide synthesis sugar transferase [Lacticaseibacillus casei A2-362]|nr:lipopolysaccharide synthesis sugar transferase [Lacticaseibacillus casei A2-362]